MGNLPDQMIYLYETNNIFKTACQLAEKLYNQNRRVQIICANELNVIALDNELWQFKQMSFIPHMTDLDTIDPKTQTIFITSKLDNMNNANTIIYCNILPSHTPDETDIIGICDVSCGQQFKSTYSPDQYFVQEINGGWQKISDSNSMK